MGALKITLDGGLLKENEGLPAIVTLKTWEGEGKIEIHEADRAKDAPAAPYTWPGAPKAVPRPGGPGNRARVAKRNDSSGVSFQRISAVLFPHRDSHRLNMTEINDVAHLLRHHTLGHMVFVTMKVKDFIDGGKRERLKEAFKIVVMTPDETVAKLQEENDWAPPAKKKTMR